MVTILYKWLLGGEVIENLKDKDEDIELMNPEDRTCILSNLQMLRKLTENLPPEPEEEEEPHEFQGGL